MVQRIEVGRGVPAEPCSSFVARGDASPYLERFHLSEEPRIAFDFPRADLLMIGAPLLGFIGDELLA